MAVLTKALTSLRSGFNSLSEDRDKASDGWIGDRAHSQTISGHNPDESGGGEYEDSDNIDEVRAIDVDKDLRESGVTMLQVIQKILQTPNDLKRLRYIIFNRVIWARSRNWKPATYSGKNLHTEHAHFSGDPVYDEDASQWSVVTLKGFSVAEIKQADWEALIWRTLALVKGTLTVEGGPKKGEAVVTNVRQIALDQKMTTILTAIGNVDEATSARLQAEFEQIDNNLAAAATVEAENAAEDAQRDANILAAIEAWESGNRTADEVLALIAEKIKPAE